MRDSAILEVCELDIGFTGEATLVCHRTKDIVQTKKQSFLHTKSYDASHAESSPTCDENGIGLEVNVTIMVDPMTLLHRPFLLRLNINSFPPTLNFFVALYRYTPLLLRLFLSQSKSTQVQKPARCYLMAFRES